MVDDGRVAPPPGLGVVAALIVVGAGCYAVPPLRIGAGGGGAAGTVATRDYDLTRRENSVAGTGQLRLGIAPITHKPKRRFDIALGWELDSVAGSEGDSMRHGPYLEVDYFLLGTAPGGAQGWRLGPSVTLEALVPRAGASADGPMDDPSFGLGGSIGGLLEYVDPVGAQARRRRVAGEFGFGVGARLGVRRVDDGVYGYGIVSVEFRLPGAYGFVF
jgi:hypothetical protein